jgi:tRNA (cytosine38-C5)-methyltransferase
MVIIPDTRSNAFKFVCKIIKEGSLPQLNYILMENVVGFEKSQMRNEFVCSLEVANFNFQEFIISPNQVGVANTRHRYYCIARKDQDFSFSKSEIVSRNNFTFG